MIITKLNYKENVNSDNYWELKDLRLSGTDVIVGLNATGKTRVHNLISNLASIWKQKSKYDGQWEIVFSRANNSNKTYEYELSINNSKIQTELIKDDGEKVLNRNLSKGKIYSKKDLKWHEFSPPDDELTANTRRDLEHYPFIEDFINWAKQLKGYSFSGLQASFVKIPDKSERLLDDLEAVPYILADCLQDSKIKENIILNMDYIGYPIEDIKVSKEHLSASPQNVYVVNLKEKDLNSYTQQKNISQGMYRALSLIVIIEYILKYDKYKTILIDDLGEGLDFDRSSKLTNLLLKKTENSDIQLIISSNDRFLINSVDMKNINFLIREGPVVTAYNYKNNKELFDRFMISGLNNFDFFNTDLRLKNN